MAECKECGRSVGFFQQVGGQCPECHEQWLRRRSEPSSDGRGGLGGESSRETLIASVLLTTESNSNLQIIERIDIVTAECAYGMNVFKDLFASVRDVFGGRSEAVQKTMRDARKTVLYELRREAHLVGANAVVAVDLDYVELSGAGNMVMLVASGTAVRINLESS